MKLGFICDTIGEVSEVWMWRQLLAFRQLSPSLLTWSCKNRQLYPLDGIPTQLIDMNQLPDRTRWQRKIDEWQIKRTRNPWGYRGDHRAIRRYLKQTRPQVILCQYGPIGLRILPAARSLKIPIAVYFLGHDVDRMPGEDPRYQDALRHNLKYFQAVIHTGMHHRAILRDLGAQEQGLHCLPHGVNIQEFCPVADKPQTDAIRFVTLSRLIPIKGLDYTLKAFALMMQKADVSAQLTLIGEGPELDNLRQLAHQLQIADRIIFTGMLPHPEMKKTLQYADVFLQHSTVREGSPVSIAEACACGLPVVSTHCGGIPDLIDHGRTGFLVEQTDSVAMADSMAQLARDADLRQQFGLAARLKIEQDFNAEKQMIKLETVLLQIADKTKSS